MKTFDDKEGQIDEDQWRETNIMQPFKWHFLRFVFFCISYFFCVLYFFLHFVFFSFEISSVMIGEI